MIPKTSRISRKEFPVLLGGMRLSTPFFSFTVKKSHTPTFKAAVVVSKKVSLKAVDRNSVKRRIYSALEEVLNKKTQISVVVYAKKEALQAKTKDFSEALKAELKRVGIL